MGQGPAPARPQELTADLLVNVPITDFERRKKDNNKKITGTSYYHAMRRVNPNDTANLI